MIGPVVAGLMVTAWGTDVPYVVNAVTFLCPLRFVARISETRAPVRGLAHARALARRRGRPEARRHRTTAPHGARRLERRARSARPRSTSPRSSSRRTRWMRATSGSARSSPRAESASRSGASSARRRSGKVGLRRNYVGSLVLMGVGWGAAALSGSIWLAVAFVVGGAAGNGSVIVCNRLLVQRGAPDQYRGRALATIMSSNYAVLGLAMAAAGVLTDVVRRARRLDRRGRRCTSSRRSSQLVMTRWLPVATAGGARRVRGELGVCGRGARQRSSACGAGTRRGGRPRERHARRRRSSASRGLLEEIEARREAEAHRRS